MTVEGETPVTAPAGGDAVPVAAPAADPVPVTPDPTAQPAPIAIDYAALAVPEELKAPELVASLRTVAEKHKLPLEAANEVLATLASAGKAEAEKFAQQRESWRAEIAGDPAMGADWSGHVSTWLDAYGSPELRKMLDETGLGDHPLLVRALVKAGKDAGEAPIVPSNGGGATVDAAARYRALYPNSPQMFQ